MEIFVIIVNVDVTRCQDWRALVRHSVRGQASYPLYHTCNRQSNKKKVTILDNAEAKIEDGSKV